MSRETSLAKNTFIMTIGTVLPKVSYLVTLPIVTAKLTKAEYGTYDLIATMVSLFLPVVSLQVQAAAFRFLIDCKDNEKEKNSIITNVVTFVTVTSLIALIILYFALLQLSPAIRILICAYFFTDILLRTLVQVVRGLSNPVLYSLCTSVQPIVNMLLVVVLVYFIGGGLEGALVAMTGSTVAALAIVLVRGKILAGIDLKLLSKDTLKELIDYSWPMIPNSLSLWLLRYSDRLVLISYIGINANAIYSAANQIPSIYSLANSAFTQAWQENASVSLKEDDAAEYYGNMFDNILRILSGILAMLIVVTPVLFMFLIRGHYSEAYYQMPLLLLAMFFSSISSFLGGIYVAHKKTKNVGITTIIAAVLNVLIDLVLIKRLEIYAASISTLSAYLFLSVYRMQNVRRFQEIKYRYANICGCVAVLVGMCILLWFHNVYLNILNFLFG
ncbi:MAG: oligosaccharide flippase family protein, partial [Lachnospiraceae bacterium]|nr:oligosaccharide flippase family protein [Lachnospiraceae bacterium]